MGDVDHIYSLLHVLPTSVTKQLGSAGRVGYTSRLLHHQVGCACGVRSVLEECLQTTWKHLLEAIARLLGDATAGTGNMVSPVAKSQLPPVGEGDRTASYTTACEERSVRDYIHLVGTAEDVGR